MPMLPALVAALRDLLGPKGYADDPAELAPWLTDWRGRVTGRAAAMLRPDTAEQVAAIVRLCAAAGVPLVPQGGNTSMVAGAVPGEADDALLLSLRRLNRVRRIDTEENLAVVEAGVVLADLHDAAAAVGRRFPLSLGAKGSATIGGLVSTNAGGTQVLRHGTMRALTLGVEAVLADGARFDDLAALPKDNRGYNVTQLLIGAEGTLGVVTAATLRLSPAVGARAVAWVGLRAPADALRLLRRLERALGDAVEGFELIPAIALELVLRHVPGTRAPLGGAWPWHALVEAVAEGAPDPGEALATALGDALAAGLVGDAVLAASERDAGEFWRLRESIAEGERAEGPGAKHDVSLPVAAMPAFLEEGAAAVGGAFPDTRVIAFGHLGDGNIHFNVGAPSTAGADPARWLAEDAPAITRFVNDLVAARGGSISAEHGIGQLKRDELLRLSDPARLGVLRAIKGALDPLNIMNPGKLVPLAEEGTGQ